MVTNGDPGQGGLKPRWKVSGVIAVLVAALISILVSGAFATLAGNRRPAVRVGGRARPAVRHSASPSVLVSPRLIQSREDPGKGMFLIASPKLQDPNFARSVVLLIDYGQNGAMGLVINRPTDVRLSRVFPDIDDLQNRADSLYFGGPVEIDKVFILIKSDSQTLNSLPLLKNLYLSGDTSTLGQVLDNKRQEARVYAGYAGWAPEQLEAEIARGDWSVVPADAQTVFDAVPAEIWEKLMNRGRIRSVKNHRRSSKDSNRIAVPSGNAPG